MNYCFMLRAAHTLYYSGLLISLQSIHKMLIPAESGPSVTNNSDLRVTMLFFLGAADQDSVLRQSLQVTPSSRPGTRS